MNVRLPYGGGIEKLTVSGKDVDSLGKTDLP